MTERQKDIKPKDNKTNVRKIRTERRKDRKISGQKDNESDS